MLLHISNRRVDLAQELLIGKVLQVNGPCGTLGVTETISFTENRINRSLYAL
jgi:hypothetical protein